MNVALKGPMATLTITANGLVTLRRELLRHLGVGPGQQVEVRTLPGGGIEVCAAQPSGTIEGFIGNLAGQSSKSIPLDEIQRAAEAGWAGEPSTSQWIQTCWCVLL
jgi:antitoxin PrlF